jgi:serine/threonine protein kinase
MVMTPDRWALVERLFHAALMRPAESRTAFLAKACGDDDALRLEIESLLAQSTGSGGLLGAPAMAMPADLAPTAGASTLIGRRIGVYELRALLGRGGMGEVYRARDTRLGRDVAIKVLARTSSDREQVARLEREARVLATLNHPHIGAIHGFEDIEGGGALVLELVEGETLAERIARGAVPLPEALTIARQIADALETAHERGIVHRDLKPTNIKITPEGIVKVLDFGLAKFDISPIESGGTQSPTISEDYTRDGVILGTPAYMSPEQVRGQSFDKRGDIWAFGCVVYEALTGQALFRGANVADTLAAVLTREPDWDSLPLSTSERTRELLQRCLDRDAKTRLRDIGEARIALSDSVLAQHSRAPISSASRLGPLRIVELGGTASALHPVISIDGSSVAYAMEDGLWVRRLDRSAGSRVISNQGVGSIAWSPSGDTLAYFLGSEVRIVRFDGSEGRAVWRPEDDQVFREDMGLAWHKSSVYVPAWGGILRVPVEGGDPEFVARWDRDSGVLNFRFPVVLDDGRTLVVNPGLFGGKKDFGTVWAFRDSIGRQILSFPDTVVIGLSYSSQTQDLLISTEGNEGFALWAASFDASHLSAGTPRRVLDDVWRPSPPSADGTLALLSGVRRQLRSLRWVDSQGRQTGSVSPEYVDQRNLALSPDGRFLAATASASNGAVPGLWIYDLKRGSETNAAPNQYAWGSWSPDSHFLAFASHGKLRLFRVGQTRPAMTVPTRTPNGFSTWSPDGQTIVFVRVTGTKGTTEIAQVGIDGRSPVRLAQIPELLGNVALSRDGRLLAYDSGTKGRTVVTVTTFPDFSTRLQVSRDAACLPQWSPNEDEVWFLDGNQLVAVRIDKDRDGCLVAGRTRTLLKASAERPLIWMFRGTVHREFATIDGKRFLLLGRDHEGERRVTLVENLRLLLQPVRPR